jgi:hypothetical protein
MRVLGLLLVIFCVGWTDFVRGNNLTVTQVALRNRNTSAGANHPDNYAFIQANLRWDNSWRISTQRVIHR